MLVSAGWAALVFALCHELLEAAELSPLGIPLQIMGRNALFFFVASGIAARILLTVTITRDGQAIHLWFWLNYRLFASWMGRNDISSCILAACYLAAWWLVLYLMDRRGWYFRA